MATFHVFDKEVQVILTLFADFFFLFFHFIFSFLLFLFWFFFLTPTFVDFLLLFFNFDELFGQRLSLADLFLKIAFLLMCQFLLHFLMFIFLTRKIVQKAIFALFLFLPDLNFLLDQFDKFLKISNIDVAPISILPGENFLEVVENRAIEFMHLGTIAVPLFHDVFLPHSAKIIFVFAKMDV